ncbi:alkaline phosphatase 4-like isoform X2 [Zootermopsis nevadensis]|uniref:alkaline phosphatase 4-like isoform X2 n=1 Tax=Zootermopsis nevadensis TaxID=136037 RepID=UPI000B8EE335|nr:alkaline phosphatase 4-like isoform X2 [Zootermopsis nevadensis]
MMLHLLIGRYATIMLVIWTAGAFYLDDKAKPASRDEKVDYRYWIRYGQERLHFEIRRQQEEARSTGKVAKNVILFIGDGMGLSTITATRIYKNQLAGGYGEENGLSFEHFPYVGLAKTYEVDSQVPDSAGTATAMLSGIKINSNLAGLDARAKYKVCDRSINEKAKVENLITWAQMAGKDTGFVTTTRVTHATLAAVYAHTNSRYWECDSKVPEEYKDCVKDVARQLVEDEPGRNLKVVLGGGLNQLGVPVEQEDYVFCTRDDKQNLVEKWKQGRKNYLFVNTSRDLMEADVSKVEYLMGLFSPGHLPYALERDTSPDGQPSLLNMTVQALKLLSQNPKGYVLLVEGGNIDNAHHEGYARHALHETSEMDDSVAYAAEVTNPDDTLIIVTADHSHTLTIAGYPERGADILGSSNIMEELRGHDILTYANGPGFAGHNNSNCSQDYWREVSEKERQDLRYRPFAGWYAEKETHAGTIPSTHTEVSKSL